MWQERRQSRDEKRKKERKKERETASRLVYASESIVSLFDSCLAEYVTHNGRHTETVIDVIVLKEVKE